MKFLKYLIWFLIVFQSQQTAFGASHFDPKNMQSILEFVNHLYNPHIQLNDLIERYNFNLADKNRLVLKDYFHWNRNYMIASLALDQENYTSWSHKKKQLIGKSEQLKYIRKCIFPNKIFMSNYISKKQGMSYAKIFLQRIEKYHAQLFALKENWVFINSLQYSEHHSKCALAIQDQRNNVLVLQGLELYRDYDS